MNRCPGSALLAAAILSLGSSSLLFAQLASDAYDTVDAVRAVDILPKVVLQSGHHRVRDRVVLERDIYAFEIESDYGVYRVHTLPMLEIGAMELRTLAQAISQFKIEDDAFAERLRGQLTVNAYSLVDVVTAPFSMAEQFANNISVKPPKSSENSPPAIHPPPDPLMWITCRAT